MMHRMVGVGDSALDRLFKPRSIAIVGASPRRSETTSIVDNLRRLGWDGALSCVNPRYDDVLGLPTVGDLSELPEVPDLVVLNVNREAVCDQLEAAAAGGAAAAVVPGLGFGELGTPDGRARQARLGDIARAGSLAVIGPNCQGLVNMLTGAAPFIDFVPASPAGRAALVSQSGSVTSSLLNNSAGVSWSHAISSGNEAVTGTADLADYLLRQPEVRALCVFAEVLRDVERFLDVAAAGVAEHKPVVVLLATRSDQARGLALSHSGALCPPHRLLEAALRRAGVVQVSTLEDLLGAAAVLTHRTPRGGRLGIIVGSGGVAELAVDEATSSRHVSVPSLSETTRRAITDSTALLSPPSNPVDYYGTSDPDAAFRAIAKALRDAPEIDDVVAITYCPRTQARIDRLAERIRASQDLDVTFALSVAGMLPHDVAGELLAEGAPVVPGVGTLVHVWDAWLDARGGARRRPHTAGGEGGDFVVPPEPTSGLEALNLLRRHGVTIAETIEVDSVADGCRAADRVGYPVVVKAADPLLLHKTEATAVVTGVISAHQLVHVLKELQLAGVERLLVQEQIRGGFEMLVGITTHDALGRFVVAGAGGLWTEQLDDVVVWPVGASGSEIEHHLGRLRCGPILEGARGVLGASDRRALLDLLITVDEIGRTSDGALGALDCNPVILGQGRAVVVDAAVVPRVAEASLR